MRKKSSAHLYYQPLDFSLFTMIFIDFHSLLNLLCVLGCSRVLILFLFLTLFFHPIFLRDSVPPCLRGEYWVLVVAPPRCVNLWQIPQRFFFLRRCRFSALCNPRICSLISSRRSWA